MPYALQAADAEMQRQLPSAFVLAAPSAGAGKSHLAQAIGSSLYPTIQLSNRVIACSIALSRDPQTALDDLAKAAGQGARAATLKAKRKRPIMFP